MSDNDDDWDFANDCREFWAEQAISQKRLYNQTRSCDSPLLNVDLIFSFGPAIVIERVLVARIRMQSLIVSSQYYFEV